MSYRDEVGNLFNQGQFEAAAALAQTALAEHPKDIRLADLLHRAKKKMRASNLQFSNEWFPTWQHIWVDAFERLGWDRMKTHQVIEIGAFEGQCTSWLTDVLLGDNNSRVVVIDPFTGSMEHVAEQKDGLFDRFNNNLRQVGQPQRLVIKRQFSSAALPELYCQKAQADFIYVDGSHTAKDVLADAVQAWPLLVKGGIMIFDDYQWQNFYPDNPALNPKMGIDAFVACYFSEIKLIPWGQSYQLFIIKR